MENQISGQPNLASLTDNVSNNINSLIKDKTIDLREVAKISALSPERLDDIAKGTAQHISLSEIVAIAHALGISEIELLS
ncbi:helix-turn-helix transcriptional regulator [Sphingobium sp. DEHP117]|uniref:helix-turn-helix domain-containing protein n=1 Tax=Sphingobium sp. DEHP117 TaxID=2993436 RepID=UPI0027D6124A|nr:helix-turn-helix domain-containing protein [Sphingobium sp. DEHP117]MDQ4422181.1 helix-turn-helix transcriptional regulator [Sphingobium sp. DEHP117]